MPLHDVPTVLSEADEDLVHDMIVDGERRNLLILASAPANVSVDAFTRQVRELTFGTVGQAGTFVVTPALWGRLHGHLGYLRLPVGGMRMFPPGVDPAARAAAASSYFVSAERIAERDPRRVERHWTWLAREHGNAQPWPRRLSRVMRAITEHERSTLLADIDAFISQRAARPAVSVPAAASPVSGAPVSGATAAPLFVELIVSGAPAEPEVLPDVLPEVAAVEVSGVAEVSPVVDASAEVTAGAPAADGSVLDADALLADALVRALPSSDILTTVMTLGGCATVTESLLFALLLAGDYDQLQAKVSALPGELSGDQDGSADLERILDLEEQVAAALAELEDVQARLDRESRAARYLRSVLIEAGRADAAFTVPEEEVEWAQDFEAVLEVARSLPHVVFTGDPERTLDLNGMRGARSAAVKTHRVLLALNDYARAKADGVFSGGSLIAFTNDPPPGYATVSRASIVPGESAVVRDSKGLRRFRMLPMPDGQLVYMDAHVRISQEATTAPRLYFLDDTAVSGRVVVGYIGAHMPNTLTN